MLKLGVALDYSQPQIKLPLEKIALAERLGYDSVWSAEAYGSDALTPLAFLAAKTQHLRLGTGLIQLAARTPAATAMAAATLDQLAGGHRASGGHRAIIGLGVSGPQIVEGWYGRPWGKPVSQLRDYVSIMRKVFKREGPVSHEGVEISLPYIGEGALGQGKPLKSILHPNPDIPIWLGCGGPASVRLMAEGQREQAFAAIPDEYIDEMGLYGDEQRIRQRFERLRSRPFTGLTIHSDNLEILELMADIAGLMPRS